MAINYRDPFESLTLQQKIHSPALRRAFIARLYNFNLDSDGAASQATDNALGMFFVRYDDLCSAAVTRDRTLEHTTHRDLLEIIHHTRKKGYSRALLLRIVREELKLRSKEDSDHSPTFTSAHLDLAASIWLMMKIGYDPGLLMYDEPVIWQEGDCLDTDVFEPTFQARYNASDVVKLPQTFTAMQLDQIGGIEVRWTDNLADHLLLRDDDSKLFLFHPVSLLELHNVSRASSLARNDPDDTIYLPHALVDETIRTVALLIPPVLGEPNPWFQAEQRRMGNTLDPAAGSCPRLNSSERRIEKFVYWRDRLVLLKRTFDDTEPNNLSRLWHDDRKKAQWFTFWVAVLVFILTVFFGVVQSVAGIVQAWASVKALKGS